MAQSNKEKALRHLSAAHFQASRIQEHVEAIQRLMRMQPEFGARAYQHAELSHIARALRDLETSLEPILDVWQEYRGEKKSN